MRCCEQDSRTYFLLGARYFFGIWLLYVGLVKWLAFGATGFVSAIVADFDKTWSPHALNTFLAWLILIAEPLFATWILSGKSPRLAWTATALLMFLLTIGQTILMKPDVIANWQYLVFTLACAAMSESKTKSA